MSDSLFSRFPLEILHGIFHYLNVQDLLQIRRVSRYLNEVSFSRDVWSDAYRTVEFIRPPGPFPSQSARDLEDALVSSYRVERNLRRNRVITQEEKQVLRLREIRHTGLELCVSLVFGRFLLIAFKEEVRCYDLTLDVFDSNSGASIIYRPAGVTLKSFHCVSATHVDGRPFACAVISESAAAETGFSIQEVTQISIFSLNIVAQSGVALDLLHQFEENEFDIGIVDLGPRVLVIQGRAGPDADADWRVIALDVHARTQLLLPSFTRATWAVSEVPEWDDITAPASISTSTHLLLARSFFTQAVGWCTFLQAFKLSSPHTCSRFVSPPTHLSPSHQGIIPAIIIGNPALLHDAAFDPSAQDVRITIRVHAFEPSRPRYSLSKYGILCLGTTHTSHNNLGTITFRFLGSLTKLSRMPFLRHPTLNGTGRAFYTFEPGSSEVAMLEYDVRGDSEEGSGAKISEFPSILRFSTPREVLDYDPYAGRLSLRITGPAKYRVIQVVDLAV